MGRCSVTLEILSVSETSRPDRPATAGARTLYDKLWDAHVVSQADDGSALIYIDRQMLHEVSSPQAFEGLRQRGLAVRRPGAQLAVADHAVPTRGRDRPIPIPDLLARAQVALLAHNTGASGLRYIPLHDSRHGIVHVIGPEQGFTLPGMPSSSWARRWRSSRWPSA